MKQYFEYLSGLSHENVTYFKILKTEGYRTLIQITNDHKLLKEPRVKSVMQLVSCYKVQII